MVSLTPVEKCSPASQSSDVLSVCSKVIKTLDPKQPVTVTPDVQALKNQLKEKERKIQHLEVCLFFFFFHVNIRRRQIGSP